MENRDREKLNREQMSRKDTSNPKKDEEVDFGKNIGRSEELNQPGRDSKSDLDEEQHGSQGSSEHSE